MTEAAPARRGRRRVFEDDALVAALRAAAAEVHGPLTRRGYAAFVAAEPPRSRPSPALVITRFGSWRAAVAAAGIDPPGLAGAPRRRRRAPDEVVAHLRAAAGDRALLTRGEYTAYREARPDAPDVAEVVDSLGSWSAALVTAGIRTVTMRGPDISDAELIAALRSVAEDGCAPTLARYRAARAARGERTLPAPGTIVQRLGSWSAALEAAGLTRAPAARTAPPAASDAIRAVRVWAAVTPLSPRTQTRYEAFRERLADNAPTAQDVTLAAGTWRDAVAGIDTDRHRDRLGDMLAGAAAIAGDPALPVERYRALERRYPGLPSYRTLYRAFGSWPAALAHAGLGATA